MNIDLSLIHEIIRKSLTSSHEEGCSDELCRVRAMFHALEAAYILCRSQPRRKQMEIIGVEKDSPLHDVIEVSLQPEYQELLHILPAMVRAMEEEISSP